jgi:hypothetical protein
MTVFESRNLKEGVLATDASVPIHQRAVILTVVLFKVKTCLA